MLCTWIRMASGELRIQLQLLMAASSTEDHVVKNVHQHQPEQQVPQGSSSSMVGVRQATGLPIGLACGRLLQSVVQYLIQLADQPHVSSNNNHISGDALLHLRQSLEQSLWTAVEYLSLLMIIHPGTPTTTQMTLMRLTTPLTLQEDPRAALFPTILRLLGTLLMEVDIFDLLEKNHPFVTMEDEDEDDNEVDSGAPNRNREPHNISSSSSPAVILTCLQGILPIAEDVSLLPGLVNILGDAEGDRDKEELLLQYLYDPLLDYLEWYWQRGSSLIHTTKTTTERGDNNTWMAKLLLDDSVLWACSCTELWVQLSVSADNKQNPGAAAAAWPSSTTRRTATSSPHQQRRRLCLALLAWIQQVLKLLQQAPPVAGSAASAAATVAIRHKNYLSLALGCYMALSKDRIEPPKEHENRVILRALQWCEP